MPIFVQQKHDIFKKPQNSFKSERCFRRKCTPAGKVDCIHLAINMAIALFHKALKNT